LSRIQSGAIGECDAYAVDQEILKNSKAGALAEQRGQSAKTVRKPAASPKSSRSKSVRGKAEASAARKSSTQRNASSAKESAKIATGKIARRPTKSAAKAAGKTGAKKTGAAKKTSAHKSVSVKLASKSATANNTAKAAAKTAVSARGSSPSGEPPKKGTAVAQKSKMSAPTKNLVVNKKQEKSVQKLRPRDITALNPVGSSPAPIASEQPTVTELTSPVASEAIQVAKNISDTAVKAVARKPISPNLGDTPNEEKIVPAKSAVLRPNRPRRESNRARRARSWGSS